MQADLTGLIERLREAKGPDKQLDLDIAVQLGQPWTYGDDLRGLAPDRYTASIDAALALVEQKLPRADWTLEPDGCWLRQMGDDDVIEHQGVLVGRGGKCTAIAILLALLSALQDQP